MEKDFITVKTFAFPADVTIVQTFMEMRGIEPLSKRIPSLTSTIIVILLELH